MSNRKKILAIILFLIFGTTIYTFANPASTPDEKDKTEEEVVEEETPEDNTNNNPIIVDDGINNIVNPIVQPNNNLGVIDENIQFAFELADLKRAAILIVRNYIDTTKVKYREEQLLEITKIIEESVKKIEEATTKEEVIIIRDKALIDLDNVLTDEDLYLKETKSVIFLDKDNKELLNTRVKIGETTISPVVELNYSVRGITYVFTKWDKDFSKVEEDLIIKPIYDINEIIGNIVLGEDSIGSVKLNISNAELLEIIKNNVDKEIEVSNINTYIKDGEILPVLADNDEFLKYSFYAISYNEEGFVILTKKVVDNESLDLYRNKAKEEIMSYRDSLIFSDSYIASADKTAADALLAILELNTKSSIDKLVMDTKGELDDLYLQNVKSNAKKELLAYSKTFPFDSSILTTVDDIVSKGNLDIDKADTIVLINSTLINYKKQISDLADVKATFSIKGSNFIRQTRTSFWNYAKNREDKYIDSGIENIDSNTNYTTSVKYIYIRPYSTTETVVDNVDLSYGAKIGTYKIIYDVKNFAGTTTLIRTVIVNRAIDEVFEGTDLQIDFSNNNVYEVCRTSYCTAPEVNLSAKAYDTVDGHFFGKTEISDRIVILSNNVNTREKGDYQVVYEVTDWSGYRYSRTRKIIVRDNIDPSISLLTEMQTISIEGYNVSVPKTIVTDNYDFSLVPTINMDDYEYEYTTEGSWFKTRFYKQKFLISVKYTAIDSSLNKKTYTYKLPNKVAISEKISIMSF